jgi:hypothetical protein
VPVVRPSNKETLSTMFAVNPTKRKLTSKCDASDDMCVLEGERRIDASTLNFFSLCRVETRAEAKTCKIHRGSNASILTV